MERNKLQNKKLKATREKNQISIALFSIELAEINTKEGQYENAITEYEDALAAYKALGKEMDFGRVHRMIGEIYCSYLGDINKALDHQNIYLKIARKENDLLEKQRAHATLGRTYFCAATLDVDNVDKKLLAESQKAYMKSIVICEELKEPVVTRIEKYDMRARLLLNLGNVFEHKGEFSKAIEYMEKAIAICGKNDLTQSLQQSYYTLALVYSHKSDFKNTLLCLNKAYDVASRLSTDRVAKQCQILLSKGEILANTGDYKSAKEILVKAFKLKHPNLNERKVIEKTLKIVASLYYTEESLISIADNEYGRKKTLYEKMGDCCCELKNYTKAIDYYKMMLENAELNNETGKNLSAAYISLAQTYKDNKEYNLALEYFEKDLNLLCNNPQDVVESYLNIADVLELSKKPYDEIESYFEKAKEVARDAKLVKLEEKCYTKLMFLQRKYGKNELAEKSLQQREALGVDLSSDSEIDEAEENPVIEKSIALSDISGLSDGSEDEENISKMNRSKRTSGGTSFKSVRKNAKGETPLHIACIKGNTNNVKLLLNQNHPVNVRDYCGWLPIHEACNHGHRDIVELLVDKGADINDRGGIDCEGTTPLHDACKNGHLEVIELLLDRGASPLVKNDLSCTPLDILLQTKSIIKYNETAQIFFDTLVDRMSTILQKAGKLETNTMSLIYEDLQTPSTSKCDRYLRISKKSPLSKHIENTPKRSPKMPTLTFDDNNDDDDEPISMNRSSATDEYRQAISNLRRKPSPEKLKLKTPTKHTAYVNSEDDWLEHDMPKEPSPKRRRINSFEIDAPSSTRSPKRTNKSPMKSKRLTLIKNNLNLELDDHVLPVEDEFNRQSENDESNVMPNILRRRKSQTTLLNAGFSRKRSSAESLQSIPMESDWSDTNMSPSRINPQPDSTTIPVSTQLVSNIISIDIHIENKIWKIPISRRNISHLTIAWLAEEASKRYYNKEAVKPTLQLETKDKAILDNSDPLEMIITCNELYTTVTSWNLPSIVERYLDACKISKTVVDFHLKRCLDSCQATLSLDLSNLNLSHEQIVPILKALKHQRTLEQLNISGNLLTDETIKILCEILPTLTSLQNFDISNNLISWESINYISELFIQNNTVLFNLRELNLSYNNIGDNSIKFLTTILKSVKIKLLNLASCQFTCDLFRNRTSDNDLLNLQSIESINLSDNILNKSNLLVFLNSLNPCLLKMIDLSGIAEFGTSYVTTELIAFLRQGTPINLEYVNLSRCRVSEFEFKELFDTLENLPKLHTINVSDNNDLTGFSLQMLLMSKVTMDNVILENCKNICVGFTSGLNNIDAIQKSIKCLQINLYDETVFKSLSLIWKNLWNENGVVRKGNDSFIEFTVK